MSDFPPILFWVAFSVCPVVAALLFIARLAVAPFSQKVSAQMRKHPLIHIIWGCLGFLGVIFNWYVFAHPMWWPPPFIERQAQRQVVRERVQKVGGWEAVRLGCETVVSNNLDGFYWNVSMSSNWVMHFQRQERYNWYLATNLDYGPLPPVIAGLRPFRVDYAPRDGCVIIQVFGMHRTGGHDTPYLAYEIDTSTNSISYQHGLEYSGAFGYRRFVVKRIAKAIYELHY